MAKIKVIVVAVAHYKSHFTVQMEQDGRVHDYYVLVLEKGQLLFMTASTLLEAADIRFLYGIQLYKDGIRVGGEFRTSYMADGGKKRFPICAMQLVSTHGEPLEIILGDEQDILFDCSVDLNSSGIIWSHTDDPAHNEEHPELLSALEIGLHFTGEYSQDPLLLAGVPGCPPAVSAVIRHTVQQTGEGEIYFSTR